MTVAAQMGRRSECRFGGGQLRIRFSLLILLLTSHSSLLAQHWGERVLEKGFERTDFFFAPSYLKPYGIGSYRSTTPALLKDPLLDLNVNPARFDLDSARTAYLYTDFRSAREVTESALPYCPVYADYATRIAASIVGGSEFLRHG